MELVWLIPALPIAGFALLLAFGRRIGEPTSGVIATVAVAASFVVSCIVAASLWSQPAEEREYVQTLWTWMPVGSFHVDFGFLLDPLSITMCLFVTGVGLLLHLIGVPWALPTAAGMAFIAAFLNAVFGLCLGCQLYLLLQRVGLWGRPA